jgi:hypothetical protein
MRITVHSGDFPPFVRGKRKPRSAAFTTKLLKFSEAVLYFGTTGRLEVCRICKISIVSPRIR